MAFNFLVLFIFDELHSGFIDDADAGEKLDRRAQRVRMRRGVGIEANYGATNLVGEEILAQSEGEC